MEDHASWRMCVPFFSYIFYHIEFQIVQVVFGGAISGELLARVVNKITVLKCINDGYSKSIE